MNILESFHIDVNYCIHFETFPFPGNFWIGEDCNPLLHSSTAIPFLRKLYYDLLRSQGDSNGEEFIDIDRMGSGVSCLITVIRLQSYICTVSVLVVTVQKNPVFEFANPLDVFLHTVPSMTWEVFTGCTWSCAQSLGLGSWSAGQSQNINILAE